MDSCHNAGMNKVIILTGSAGSGKDTVAQALKNHFEKMEEAKFSAALKDLVCDMFIWDRNRIDSDLEYKQEIARWPGGGAVSNTSAGPRTRRELLQLVGTDMVRDMIDKDFWVKRTLLQMRMESHPDSRWVVSDCRFWNEYEALKRSFNECFVLRLHRMGHTIEESSHPSEQEWKEIPADAEIEVWSGDISRLTEGSISLVKYFLEDE